MHAAQVAPEPNLGRRLQLARDPPLFVLVLRDHYLGHARDVTRRPGRLIGGHQARSEAKSNTMIEGLLSPMHLLLILAVALLGPKRLPEAGRGIGSAIRGFKGLAVHAEQPRRPARHRETARA